MSRIARWRRRISCSRVGPFLGSIGFAITLMLCSPRFADRALAQSSATYIYTPLGYEQIINPSAATNLTVPNAARIIQICVETNSVRYRDDGTAPTASVGMPAAPGTCWQYSGDLVNIQFIQQTSPSTLDVSYYR
jgi:hypothetical protein